MWWKQHLNTLNNTKENKRRCGRTEIIFPAEEKEYIEKDQLKVGPQTSLLAVQSEPSLVQ
jgi:hypothetical protein